MKLFQLSIRTYLVLMNVVLLCLLFPSVSYLLLEQEKRSRDTQLERSIDNLLDGIKKRNGTLAKSMSLSAGQAVAGYDFTFLSIMAEQVALDDPEVIYCIIMTRNRLAIAHSDTKLAGSILFHAVDYQAAEVLDYQHTSLKPDRVPNNKQVHFLEIEEGYVPSSTRTMEAVVPVYSGSELWGILRLGFSLNSLNEQTRIVKEESAQKLRQFKIYLITVTVTFLSLGIISAALFTRLFVRSMEVLSKGVDKVSEGDLGHVIPAKGVIVSEFSKLLTAFNEMTEKLRDSYGKLDEYSTYLEEKVSERTRELEDAQINLLQQAHESGMAEMAVGMLHNIGNAITPAKIGALLLTKRLTGSPLRSGLTAPCTAITETLSKTPVFSGNEKEKLIKIIRLLPDTINEEYEHIIDKLEQIQEKHRHIENIITLQMRYANIFGEAEKVELSQIVEDALDLIQDSLSNRPIKIVKTISPVEKVNISKTKLMQIIVNLLKNSIEALGANADKTGQIEIIVSRDQTPTPCLFLSVKDNGIGFSSQEKENLFSFGYTTKSRGTGFGLHSCANYLSANNASLTAFSKGKGQGAEFTIRFFNVETESRKE